MQTREQLLARQRSVLEMALVREVVMREWCESVACAFAFDLARGQDVAGEWYAALAAAKDSTHSQS